MRKTDRDCHACYESDHGVTAFSEGFVWEESEVEGEYGDLDQAYGPWIQKSNNISDLA